MTDGGKRRRRPTENPHWRKAFLDNLAASSNVTKSAEAAKIDTGKVYRFRRENSQFARDWLAALWEGYAHLEMEVLRRLREGDLTTGDSTKYDFANAIRLLNAHRENVVHAQAEQRNVSASEVRASIDRKIEDIRLQVRNEKRRSTD
ncbi:MAG: hypothetical protein AAGK02_07575 [Pseudomonadota bacterium]